MSKLAWYKFNNGYRDCSGNQYDATNSGTSFVDGKIHYGAEFIDANDDYISLPLTFYADMLTSFSFTCWINPSSFDGTNGNQIISCYPIRLYIGIDTNKNPQVAMSSDGASWQTSVTDTSTTFEVDTWYHIGVTFDGANTTLKIYINGDNTKTETSTISALFGTNPTSVRIGDYQNAGNLFHFDGVIDHVKIEDEILTDRQMLYWFKYYERYDVWINYKSFAPQLMGGDYTSSIGAAGEIELLMNDRNDYVENYIDYENDIMLFYKGEIMFRGKVEIIDNNEIKTLTIEGRDYTSILFDRSAINKQYTDKTRGEIIAGLCASYVTTGQGPIAFDTSNVDNVTSTILSPLYSNEKLASIFFRFSNEDNALLFIEPTTTNTMNLYYKVLGDASLYTGIDYDWDNPNNTTAGEGLRQFSFKRDSKEVKNVFTVYGPASSGIAVSIRDFPSIELYGEKWAEPIVDTEATTIAKAKARALEIKNRYNQVLTRGSVVTKDSALLQQGKNFKLTVSKLGYLADAITIFDVVHTLNDKTAVMSVVNVVRSSAEIMSDVVSDQRTQNLRDADPVNTPISEIIENTIEPVFKFTLTVTELGSLVINSRIGVMVIGTFQIGNEDIATPIERETDINMILTNDGKTYFRDLITDNPATNVNQLTTTYCHASLEDDVAHPTYTESTSALSIEAYGTRVATTTPDVATNYTAKWEFTFDDTFAGGAGNFLYGVGMFDASSTGNLIAVISHSQIEKVTGNDLVYEISMEVQ